MSSLVYAVRRLVESNLGWFHRTRETLGEASGRERAININREILIEWFPSADLSAQDPFPITCRYFHSVGPAIPSKIVSDQRSIRNQGGGKNWRLAGDAIQGEFYDVRVGDLLFMVFDRQTNNLSWLVLRQGGQKGRAVSDQEAKTHEAIGLLLGKDSGNMWLLKNTDAIKLINKTKSVYPNSGDLMMEQKAFINAWSEDLSKSNFQVINHVQRRLAISLQAKPFLILTGLSGSGKSLLARSFARWITKSPSQYHLVPVGANWTSSEHILGYADALDSGRYHKTAALELFIRAQNDPENPYFLILDEMNLSHVERYFADILSAIESPVEPIRLHSATAVIDGVPPYLSGFPGNIFVIGTVNIDETTYMFSPKVLDRANVIEFRTSAKAIADFLSQPVRPDFTGLEGKGQAYGPGFVQKAKSTVDIEKLSDPLRNVITTEMMFLFKLLSKNELEFGFRTVHEIIRYITNDLEASGSFDINDLRPAIDIQILQKILPRLHGSKRKLGSLLQELIIYCSEVHDWKDDGLINVAQIEQALLQGRKGQVPEYKDRFFPASADKLQRMMARLDSNGFVSFAEA